MTAITPQQLLNEAAEARTRAYAPYSDFTVGAAMLSADGRIFLGCNIENAAYSPSCCAERVALFKAVSEGARAFAAIAVVGGKAGKTGACCPPCGVCRQALAEFCPPDMPVYLEKDGKPYTTTLADLLPLAFSLKEKKS